MQLLERMKKLNVKLILAAGLLVGTAFSGTFAYSFDNGYGCNFSPHDPYSPDIRMYRGDYKGRCMDTSAKRAVQILNQKDQDHVTITNYRKDGNFYTAEIPLHYLEKVSYLIVDLNPKPINAGGAINVSHTELRFKFAKADAIKLTPQNPADTPTTDGDFVVSYNFMGPAGVDYDPVAGFDDQLFGGVVQFFSMHDEVQTRFVKRKLNVYELPFKISAQEGSKILLQAARTSEKLAYDSLYDTWTNNCTTLLYDIIDQALNLDVKPYRFRGRMAGDTGMIPGILALDDRGLVLQDTKVSLVNPQFGYKRLPSWSNIYFGYWDGKSVREVKKAFWIAK